MRTFGWSVLVLVALSACDESSGVRVLDGGTSGVDGGRADGSRPRPDGALVDAGIDPGIDAASGAAYLAPCASDASCADGLTCAVDFARPFCTRACDDDPQCGADGHCVDDRCTPRCRSGARDCDEFGAACLVGPEVSFCVSTCGAGPGYTCPGALQCDRFDGTCTRTVSREGREVGEPCTTAADCRSGQCIAEVEASGPTGFVDGYCIATTRFDGPPPDGEPRQGGCPAGSVVFPGSMSAVGDVTACLKACTRPDECREGYFCGAVDDRARTGFCTPLDCSGGAACPAGTSCQQVNGASRCAPCTPQCDGRTCGTDGCGGSCGSCDDRSRCTAAGVCECIAEMDSALCRTAGAECGPLNVVDRCGVSRAIASCGTCSGRETCGTVSANQCDCVAETDAELCAARNAQCGTLNVTDRCGRSRRPTCGGGCQAPETCGGAGTPNRCGVCTPMCTGRACGSNGCGGSCGSCGSTERCSTAGRCEVAPCDPVRNTGCASGSRCEWNGSTTSCITVLQNGIAGSGCPATNYCGGEHTCTGEGFCRQYCEGPADCNQGECALALNGSPYGLCSRPCNPDLGAGSSGCNPGEACRLLNSARATEVTDCGEYGTRYEGDSCGSTAECARGYTCVSSACRRVCTLGSRCASGECSVVGGWSTYGVCPPS